MYKIPNFKPAIANVMQAGFITFNFLLLTYY